jgi:voltage-gated potassium channel
MDDLNKIEKEQPPVPGRYQALRDRLYRIIFLADTPEGKLYDVVLILTVMLSVLAVMLDSVDAVHRRFGSFLYAVEWGFTLLFTIDYLVRLYCVGRTLRYVFSFYGVVDLLGVIPTYLGYAFPLSLGSGRYLIAIRFLRVLRVFRVLKLASYVDEARLLGQAIRASRKRITVFLLTVLTLVVILGSLMYVVEGGTNGFTSIPRSIYWAIVTLTTVGYGDISPQTGLGQALAAFVMITGYSIIIVLTGIVTLEMASATRTDGAQRACPHCGREGHEEDARYCKYCGGKLA